MPFPSGVSHPSPTVSPWEEPKLNSKLPTFFFFSLSILCKTMKKIPKPKKVNKGCPSKKISSLFFGFSFFFYNTHCTVEFPFKKKIFQKIIAKNCAIQVLVGSGFSFFLLNFLGNWVFLFDRLCKFLDTLFMIFCSFFD